MVSIAIQWRGKITYRKEYVRDLGTLDDPGVVDDGTGDTFDAFDSGVLDEHLDFLGELLGVEPGFRLQTEEGASCDEGVERNKVARTEKEGH